MRDDLLSDPQPRHVGMWLGHAFFAVYCAIAIVYFRERVLYDTAVFLNTGPLLNGTFFSALGRVTVQYPPQVLPLIAVKLGMSSQAAAMAYSLNFALFHYVAWILIVHIFRRVDLGIAFIVCVLLYLVHNHIFIQGDVLHAMVYVFPFIALAEQDEPDAWAARGGRFALTTLFAAAACFGHPLMLGMIAYYALYVMVVRKRVDVLLAVSVVLSIAAYVSYKLLMIEGYESGAFSKTFQLHNFYESVAVLPGYIRNAHIVGIALFVLLLLRSLLDSRNAIAVILAIGAAGGLLFAVCSWLPLSAHSNWQFSGYTWMYFLSVYFVIVIPLFDERLVASKERHWRFRRWIHVTVVVVVALWAAGGTALDFHLARQRHLFISRVRDSLADVKPPIYLLDHQFSMNPLIRENDITFWDDSLLVSSYEGPDKACMVIPPYGWNNGKGDQYRKSYMRPLNARYFAIPSAGTQNAQVVNQTVSLDELRAAALHLAIHFPEKPAEISFRGGAPEDYRKPLELVYSAPIAFENLGVAPFPSRVTLDDQSPGETHPVAIGYYWLSGGRIVEGDRSVESLAIDVHKKFVQNIPVTRRGVPDDATLFVGLFVNGEFIPCANVTDLPQRRKTSRSLMAPREETVTPRS